MISLHNPERLNAYTPALGDELFEVLEILGADTSIAAAVLTGSGGAFSAGADLRILEDILGGKEPVATRRPHTSALEFPKPLVAAVQGPCVGWGFVQATYCDARFVASDARISTAFARRGLIAEFGVAHVLPLLVGRAVALDLLLSGRTVSGDEALSLGWAQRVVDKGDVLEAAVAYADKMVTWSSPASVRIIKEQVNAGQLQAMDQALEQSLELMVESFRRKDLIEGLASFVERREPRFPVDHPTRP